VAKARTAKQRAALRKAQLASARKRKGKGKRSNWSDGTKGGLAGIGRAGNASYGKVQGPRTKYRRGVNAKNARRVAAAGAVALVGAAFAYDYRNNKKRMKNAAPVRSAPVRIARIRIRTVPKTTATRSSASSSTFDSRYNAAVAFRQSQVKEAKRKRTNARYARVSQKVAARGMYNSGLNSNVGGRTFVAGRGGTYRR
jgi:hypothetical protein